MLRSPAIRLSESCPVAWMEASSAPKGGISGPRRCLFPRSGRSRGEALQAGLVRHHRLTAHQPSNHTLEVGGAGDEQMLQMHPLKTSITGMAQTMGTHHLAQGGFYS